MKPILFSTEMVRAILAGRKMQTRRVNKEWNDYCEPLSEFIDNKKRTYAVQNYGDKEHTDYVSLCERDMPICKGDLLWVRETWCDVYDIKGMNKQPRQIRDCDTFYYKADYDAETAQQCVRKWRPSIHMPKEAARIFLKVTNVRVERLQDITQSDCEAEGVPSTNGRQKGEMLWNAFCVSNYSNLWDSIYQKQGYGWETNPFVWVYEFEKVEVEG